jgi:5-methylcytosine-specific restriction endonuclease McrA
MAARQRSRTLQVYQDTDGMVVVRGRLTPEVGAVLIQALNAARDRLYAKARVNDPEGDPPWHGQQQADALGIIAEAALMHDLDPGPSGDRYQVVVHVDAPVLADADQPGQSVLEDGQHVPAGTCQRLACDASRRVMRHDADGRMVEISARTRTISPALRRALQHRDHGCRFPGCGLPFSQGHHIRHWAQGGPTTLSNLTLLCRRHHRSVHEDGFQVERLPDGELEFRRPDGRLLPAAPLLPPAKEDAVDHLRAVNEAAGLHVDGRALSGTWSGERFDVGYAISVLHPRAAVPSLQAIANWIDDDLIADDRPYVVRRRKADGTDVDVRIDTFDVEKYRCGLRAADRLRLRRPLPRQDDAGTTEQPGDMPWVVLAGSSQDPGTLWLRQPDGKLQSWPDDESIFEHFAKLADF